MNYLNELIHYFPKSFLQTIVKVQSHFEGKKSPLYTVNTVVSAMVKHVSLAPAYIEIQNQTQCGQT